MGQILRIEQKEGRQCPVHTKVIYRLGFNRFCDTGMSVSQWLREQLERAVVLSRAGTNPRIISKICGDSSWAGAKGARMSCNVQETPAHLS